MAIPNRIILLLKAPKLPKITYGKSVFIYYKALIFGLVFSLNYDWLPAFIHR